MSAAIAIAVGVRAEIWQIDVPSLMRVRRRAPPRERRQRVGAVRLGGPARVEAEPLRFGEPFRHTGRRTRAPVTDHVSEFHGAHGTRSLTAAPFESRPMARRQEEGIRQHRFTPPPGATTVLVVRHGESAAEIPGKPFPLRDGHGDPGAAPRRRAPGRAARRPAGARADHRDLRHHAAPHAPDRGAARGAARHHAGRGARPARGVPRRLGRRRCSARKAIDNDPVFERDLPCRNAGT